MILPLLSVNSGQSEPNIYKQLLESLLAEINIKLAHIMKDVSEKISVNINISLHRNL